MSTPSSTLGELHIYGCTCLKHKWQPLLLSLTFYAVITGISTVIYTVIPGNLYCLPCCYPWKSILLSLLLSLAISTVFSAVIPGNLYCYLFCYPWQSLLLSLLLSLASLPIVAQNCPWEWTGAQDLHSTIM